MSVGGLTAMLLALTALVLAPWALGGKTQINKLKGTIDDNPNYPIKLQLSQQRRHGKTKRLARNPDFQTLMQCFQQDGSKGPVAELDFNYPMAAKVSRRGRGFHHRWRKLRATDPNWKVKGAKISGSFNRRYRKAEGSLRVTMLYKPQSLTCKTYNQNWAASR